MGRQDTWEGLRSSGGRDRLDPGVHSNSSAHTLPCFSFHKKISIGPIVPIAHSTGPTLAFWLEVA